MQKYPLPINNMKLKRRFISVERSRLFPWAAVVFLIFWGCDDQSCELPEEIAEVSIDLQWESLEDKFFMLNSPEKVSQFMDENPVLAEAFYQRSQYPDDSIVVNRILAMASNPSLEIRLKVI